MDFQCLAKAQSFPGCVDAKLNSRILDAGTSFEVAEQAFHVLSVHTNGLRTESILDSTRSLISSNLPVTETSLMMLLSITVPLLRPRKNFSDPVAAAHPYMSLMTSEERIEGLGVTRGSSAVDLATAQGAADRFISEEERFEDDIEAGVLEDMEQLRYHVHDLFIRSFVNPLIEAAGPQYDKLLHPELDPIDDKVTFPRGVEFGGPDLANPSAWKGDAFLVLQRWCRMMELLAAPFPGYKESTEPAADENIFERVSSMALPPHLTHVGAVDFENSETCYSQCFTRLCLLENACVLVSSKAFTSPVITALEATIAEKSAEEENSNVCSKDVHRMKLLLERFTQRSQSMLSFRDKVRKQVLDLKATLIEDAATFWRNGVPQERLDREFRARIRLVCAAHLHPRNSRAICRAQILSLSLSSSLSLSPSFFLFFSLLSLSLHTHPLTFGPKSAPPSGICETTFSGGFALQATSSMKAPLSQTLGATTSV